MKYASDRLSQQTHAAEDFKMKLMILVPDLQHSAVRSKLNVAFFCCRSFFYEKKVFESPACSFFSVWDGDLKGWPDVIMILCDMREVLLLTWFVIEFRLFVAFPEVSAPSA